MGFAILQKCRRCSEIYIDGTCPSYGDFADIVHDRKDGTQAAFSLVDMHQCADGGLGVTDMIGAAKFTYGDDQKLLIQKESAQAETKR